jgi:predicted GIY-YIG superfamily endonuclease
VTGVERTALYRLYDGREQLLYVGVTRNVRRRWEFHRKDKSWWSEVRIREIEWLPSREEALAQEATETAPCTSWVS